MRNKTYIRIMNSKAWRETRAAKLHANPLCERCKAEGYITSAHCVHHIIPIESGRTDDECMELATRWSNLMALCDRCHAEIHTKEGYHTKEAHQQRNMDRLRQWIERHERGCSRKVDAEGATPGGGHFS